MSTTKLRSYFIYLKNIIGHISCILKIIFNIDESDESKKIIFLWKNWLKSVHSICVFGFNGIHGIFALH